MDARLVVLVALLSIEVICMSDRRPVTRPGQCAEFSSRSTTKFPRGDNLLSIEDFMTIVVDRLYSKFYHAMTRKYWKPSVHFFTRFQKINDTTYRRKNFADYIFSNECYRSEFTLTLDETEPNKTVFTDEYNGALAIISSCPDQYYIKYFCLKYEPGLTECAVTDTMISVYLPDSADDIPLHKIVDDLYSATGVRFGASNFIWTFTYGQNVLCNKC